MRQRRPSRLFFNFCEARKKSTNSNGKSAPASAVKELSPPPSLIDPEGRGAFDPEGIALVIDADLDSQIWNGTEWSDRVYQVTEDLTRGLLQQMERSLVAQEDYDTFEARMLKSVGLDDVEPAGALRDLETRLVTENRIAWNRATIAAQDGGGGETVTVWSSRLEPPSGRGRGTTPGCAWSHGRDLIDLPDPTIPKHWGCKCQLIVLPDPSSSDPDQAAIGQSILDSMAEDREDFLATYYPNATGFEESSKHSVRPSRLFSSAVKI